MNCVIDGPMVIHGTKSWGQAEVPLEIEGNKLLDGRAVAAHLVVCCVLCVVSILLAFPLLIVD
jgi:hypothetical protein